MARLRVHGASAPLRGSVPVPSDKSIGHRALILASLARGRSEIRGFSYGEDNVATLAAFRAMGIGIDDDQKGTVRPEGRGLYGLSAPAGPIDCGNSGTSMRLLCGVLSGQPFAARLVGDASLSRRPMRRVAEPLRMRGARVEGKPHPTHAGEITPPLEVGPLEAGTRLGPLEYALPVASAQVKSALLLSGLYASGPTLLSEPVVSRDHTERMLDALGIPIDAAGSHLKLHPPASRDALAGFEIDLPGDISAAAFVLAAGLLVEDSVVTTRRTGLNPTRGGFVEAVRQLGGRIAARPEGGALGEPCGEVTAAFSVLTGRLLGGELVTRAIDEIPILAALGARARGTTRFVDVGELRVKESDRIATMVATLRAFGVTAEEADDGFAVEGRPEGRLRPARVASHGDHRIAMAAAVLGLVAEGVTEIDDVDCIATSFPRFVGTLGALGARIEVVS